MGGKRIAEYSKWPQQIKKHIQFHKFTKKKNKNLNWNEEEETKGKYSVNGELKALYFMYDHLNILIFYILNLIQSTYFQIDLCLTPSN